MEKLVKCGNPYVESGIDSCPWDDEEEGFRDCYVMGCPWLMVDGKQVFDSGEGDDGY